MSDYSESLKAAMCDMLCPNGLGHGSSLKLHTKSVLDRAGLDPDEICAGEEASQSSELTEIYERWLAAGGARDCEDNSMRIYEHDIALVIACRQLFSKYLERESKREKEYYEEHA